MEDQNEYWKPIKKYNGWYSVSNFGRVRRDKRTKTGIFGRILKPQLGHRNYLQVSLFKNKHNKKTFTIHRLVTITFIGKRPIGYSVNHKDCNKNNNSIDNLEYITPQQNANHAKINNLFLVGENHPSSKLTIKNVIKIRKEYIPRINSQRKLAKKYGVSQPAIRMIIIKKNWRHVKD